MRISTILVSWPWRKAENLSLQNFKTSTPASTLKECPPKLETLHSPLTHVGVSNISTTRKRALTDLKQIRLRTRFSSPCATRANQLAYAMSGRGGQRKSVLLPPINCIFRLLQQRSTVVIWLYEQLGMRIEGIIQVNRPIKKSSGVRKADSVK